MKSLFAFLLVSAFSLNVSAAPFTLTLSEKGESSKGMFMSNEMATVNPNETTVYELISATSAVQQKLTQESLKTRTCNLGGITVEGSVLSSTTEYDQESRTGNVTYTKLLVRSILGCAGAR